MILDYNTEVSKAQTVTSSAASTDYIDAKAPVRAGEVRFNINLTTITGTGPTLTVAVQGATDTAFTTPITVASVTPVLAVGVNMNVPAICNIVPALRYYRLYYTTGGTTPSMVVTAGVADDVQADFQKP